MLRRITVLFAALALLTTAATAHAQEDDGQSTREKRGWSLGAGIGFLADVNTAGGPTQFLMQFDALYNVSNKFAMGATFQVGPAGGSSTIALSFDGRFYLGKGDGPLTPYVGAGIGFRDNTGATGGADFLFPILFGVEIDVTDALAVTSDMRLNITSGDDNFYYSWQILGARLRF